VGGTITYPFPYFLIVISENGDTKTGVVPRESSISSKSIEIFDTNDGFLRDDRDSRDGVGGGDGEACVGEACVGEACVGEACVGVACVEVPENG